MCSLAEVSRMNFPYLTSIASDWPLISNRALHREDHDELCQLEPGSRKLHRPSARHRRKHTPSAGNTIQSD